VAYNAPERRVLPGILTTTLLMGIAAGLRVAVATMLRLQQDEASSFLERSFAYLMADEERFFNPVPWRAINVVLLNLTDDLLTLRMASVACAVAAVGWLASFAGRRVGPVGGWIAGLGLACTPWLVRQTGQFRSYGLTLLAATLVATSVFSLLERPTKRRLLTSAVVVGLAGWAHFILLPWTVLWAIAALFVARDSRLRGVGVVAVIVVASLAVHPAWLAFGGLMLKRGGPSASMQARDAIDVVWRPELAVLVVSFLAAAWPGKVRRGGNSALILLAFAAVFGGIILAAGGQLRTIRWGHLVAIAPAVWLCCGAFIDGACRPSRRAAVSVSVVASLLAAVMASSLLGALGDGVLRRDEVALARWMKARPDVDVVALEREFSGLMQPRANGVAHALGYYAGGPERCVGADVIHLRRCRAQSRVMRHGEEAVRGWCREGRCIYPLNDAATPLDSAPKPSKTTIVAVIPQLAEATEPPFPGCERGEAGGWWLCRALENQR